MNNIINNELSNILIFSFDEKNAEYDSTYNDNKLSQFIEKVHKKKPNIIFICTQNSISRTDKHLQHLIGKKLPENYKRFSKVDATRQSNLKKLYYRNLRNVRTRIYYNTNTVDFQQYKFNRFNKQSYTKKSIFNYSDNSNNTNLERSTIHRFLNNKIEIVYYKYRRHTAIGEDGRNGSGGIMTSIILEKNYIKYTYIVCNFVGLNNKNIINKIYEINKNIDSHNAYYKYNLMYNNEPKLVRDRTHSIGNNIEIKNKRLMFKGGSNTSSESSESSESESSESGSLLYNNNSDLPKIFLYFISTKGLEKFKTTSNKNKNKNKNQYFTLKIEES
jgi:hypothetical protein